MYLEIWDSKLQINGIRLFIEKSQSNHRLLMKKVLNCKVYLDLRALSL